ncbi:15589_t:CDS:1, partial [Acaulospora colombiana]
EEKWRELSEPFLSLPTDLSLSIIDPAILPFLIADGQTDEHTVSPEVAYDVYGLSVYGRLGLFSLELINKFGISTFFGIDAGNLSETASKEAKISSYSHWILLELLLIYVLCSDNYRSRTNSYHLWDVNHTEESDYHGLKAYLGEVHVIMRQYTDFNVRNGCFDVKSLIARLISTDSSTEVQIDHISRLIEEA